VSPAPVVAIVGLGYVGLPLALAFGQRYATIGYDLAEAKLAAYRECRDPTGEMSAADLRAASHLEYTHDPRRLASADFVILAIPTPVDAARKPDFAPLIAASRTVAQHLKRGATVIYESTVYPGATEEVCIPVLEAHSGLRWREDFHVGYSPERINPGDREHTLTRIVKLVAGDTPATLERVAALYASIVEAGVYRAASIKVAEAAKVIENTQRDLNIALMNELAIIFDRIGIDTGAVLAAADTKWNFLKFKPGLVGGHCIGVDPYYLTHKAEMLGYQPQVILAGRRINDGMGKFVAEKTVKLMIQQGTHIKGAQVVVLGLTFKEDCPDLRNSKVIDVIRELQDYGCAVTMHDPLADPAEALQEYGVTLTPWQNLPQQADALVLAVAHQAYREMTPEKLLASLQAAGIIIDVKSVVADAGDHPLWRL